MAKGADPSALTDDVRPLAHSEKSVRKREAILRAAFMRMERDAPLYLFTYGRNCPVPDAVLRRLDLDAVRVATIRRNIPPASVYRIASCRAKAD